MMQRSWLLITPFSWQDLQKRATRYMRPGPPEGNQHWPPLLGTQEQHAAGKHTHLLVQHVRAGHGVKITRLHKLLAH